MTEKVACILKGKDKLCDEIIIVLLNALSKDELSELNEALLFDEDTFLRRLIKYRLKEKTVKQSNKSISLLLKQYCDKKSKCVVSSRRELQNRYPYQSQQCQRKIISAFLMSGAKSDRRWAYSVLYKEWDPYYKNLIAKLWKEQRETMCEWLVVKYLPTDFLMNNLEMFHKSSYKFLCVRLVNTNGFTIDRSLLSDYDYIYVAAKTKIDIDKKFVQRYLYTYIIETINAMDDLSLEIDLRPRKRFYTIGATSSLCDLGKVQKILWCMSELGMIDELIEFNGWEVEIWDKYYETCDELCDENLFNTKIFRESVKSFVTPIELLEYEKSKMRELFGCDYVDYELITDDYLEELKVIKDGEEKAKMLEKMKAENPEFSAVMEDLELE